MPNTSLQRTLLALLEEPRSPAAACVAVRILVRIEPPPEFWIEAEPALLALLPAIDNAMPIEPRILEAALQVPLASVRHRVETLSSSGHEPTRLAALRVLSAGGDAAAANRLIAALEDHPRSDVAYALAAAPGAVGDAELGALDACVSTLDRSDDDQANASIWGAIALARQGRDAALDKALDRLKAGWMPTMFHGNPFALREDIAHAVAGSASVAGFAQQRMDALSEDQRGAISSEAHLGHPHLLLLDALTQSSLERIRRPSIAAQDARANVEEVLDSELAPYRAVCAPQVTAALDAGQFADVLPSALHAVASSTPPGAGDIADVVGNGLVALVEALPAHQPNGGAVIDAYAWLCDSTDATWPDLERQLGWALAQGDFNALTSACGERLAAPGVAISASALLDHAIDATPETFGPRVGAGATRALAGRFALPTSLIVTDAFREQIRNERAAAAPGESPRGGPRDDTPRTAPPEDDVPRSGAPEDDAGDDQAPGDEPDRRETYAKLDCPDSVRPEVWFDVQVGLSPKPSAGVSGGALGLPATLGDTFEVAIHLDADGFRVHDDDSLSVVLRVTPNERYPTRTVRLCALDDAAFSAHRILMAKFKVEGQMIGAAARTVAVNADAESRQSATGINMVVPPRDQAPDLTITITRGNTQGADRLLWSLDSPHTNLDVAPPDDPADSASNLGEETGKWARNLMNEVHQNASDASDLALVLAGTGGHIRDKIPVWVQRSLVQLAAMSGEAKTILLVSNEPNVPWELAYLTLADGDGGERENFLGAEFSVGRWVIGRESPVTGVVKPVYPPPTSVDVKRMAVVSGDYTQTRGWKDLAGAHEEAKALVERYNAISVDSDGALAAWLKSAQDVDLIHFAVHGKWDLAGSSGGIALVDGSMLTPSKIAGLRLKNAPFIFLNACQLGQGEQTLGDYGGVAAAFLQAGASGVIASLWNVDDAAAKALALSFYDSAHELKDGASDFIRNVRARFSDAVPDDDPAARAPSLLLAYQFFGHPRMRLELEMGAAS